MLGCIFELILKYLLQSHLAPSGYLKLPNVSKDDLTIGSMKMINIW